MTDSEFDGKADQWDPLAPSDYRDETPEEIVDDAAPAPSDCPTEAVEEVPIDERDGGYSDPLHVVRVWVEGDRLVRVRISNIWQHKLKTEKASLAHCILAALITAWADQSPALSGEPAQEHPEPSVDESELLEFSSLAEAQAALEACVAEFDARYQELSQLEPPMTRGHAGGATVVVDPSGRITNVEFKESWIARADVSTINHSVRRLRRRLITSCQPITLPNNCKISSINTKWFAPRCRPGSTKETGNDRQALGR